MNNSLFPNIRGALRGEVVKEQGVILGQPQKDPIDDLTPQDRIKYNTELQKLDVREEQLRSQIDNVKKLKADLKQKYKLSA